MPETANVPDYTDDLPVPKEEALAQLAKLARLQVEQEQELVRCQQRVADAEKALADTKLKLIPELLDSIGLEKCTTVDGLTVSVEEDIRCGLPSAKEHPEKRAAAFLALERLGAIDLIKNKFVIEFDREDEGWANTFEAQMRRRKRPLDYARSKDVNFQTLSKWARDRLKLGKEVPVDVLNFHRQRVAHVDPPKK